MERESMVDAFEDKVNILQVGLYSGCPAETCATVARLTRCFSRILTYARRAPRNRVGTLGAMIVEAAVKSTVLIWRICSERHGYLA